MSRLTIIRIMNGIRKALFHYLNGDSLLSLEVHGVHLRPHSVLAPHVMDLTDSTGIEQDPLSQSRLPGINMCRDPDIANIMNIANGNREQPRLKANST